MDYKKKYENALTYIRDLIEHNVISIESAGKYFPELKESDDEKIRKKLIDFFSKGAKYGAQTNGIYDKDIIVWLEKQGEHANFRNKIQIGDKVTRNEDGALVNLSQLKRVAKPTDKVEPKFKAEDWIVRELDNSVHQVKAVIENISNGKYWYDLTKGGYISSQDANFYHLWTIKDAKAGDVLVIQETDFTYESIFIFNKIENNHIIQYLHYFITDTDEEVCKVKSVGGFIGDVGDNVHPATKEQREQLKKAMTDAGYAFNFDKKELKKIEVEPAWSYEDEANLNNIIWLCNNCIKGSETTWIPSQATKIKHLIETIKEKGLVQQNPAWSEEDKKTLERVIRCIENHDYMNVDDIHWLKSLKDRCTWRPSDEQMKAFENFVRGILESCYDSPYENNAKLLYSLLEQLKKLK